jgi:predicted DsbA family dithiol-disulfide isomerase
MTLHFYFDPICSWTWQTSLWVREVREHSKLEIQWKVLSLSEMNRGHDAQAGIHAKSDKALRILVQARREGGNAAIDRLYLALGQAQRRQNMDSEEVLEAALEEAQLDRALLRQALDDSSTQDEVMADHDEAVTRYGAFGSPWLVLEDQEFGFFGPVIANVPRGAAALELWGHISWLLQQPHFYELKRARTEGIQEQQ